MLKSICTLWINDSSISIEFTENKITASVTSSKQTIMSTWARKYLQYLYAIRSWSFQNICNEIGWPRFFCATLYIIYDDTSRFAVQMQIIIIWDLLVLSESNIRTNRHWNSSLRWWKDELWTDKALCNIFG